MSDLKRLAPVMIGDKRVGDGQKMLYGGRNWDQSQW